MRRTLVVYSPHAARMARFRFAHLHATDCQILTIEQLAARLAGGFLVPISSAQTLHALELLSKLQNAAFEAISGLPGFRRALAATLQKAWNADVDFAAQAHLADGTAAARFLALSEIEAHVMSHVPPNARRPAEIARAASERAHFAGRLFGDITIENHTELHPVWRPLLTELAAHTNVIWDGGPRVQPPWLAGQTLEVRTAAPQVPALEVLSCATARHEMLAAVRWVRALLSDGRARPAEIAIACPSPAAWNDYLESLLRESDLAVHCISGERLVARPEGQYMLALADLIVSGASTARLIRFVGLACELDQRFNQCDPHWWLELPARIQLADTARWLAFLATDDTPEIQCNAPLLREILEQIQRGPAAAHEIGRRLLPAHHHAVWQSLLARVPITALAAEVANKRIPSTVRPETSVVFGSAADIAAAPRPFVWLLGLNAGNWPRHAGEDPLLPDHYIERARLDPLPIHDADRRDFATILATTATEVNCSFSRRDASGAALGRSPLLPRQAPERYYAFAEVPLVPANAADWRLANWAMSAREPEVNKAANAYRAWQSTAVTAHDGAFDGSHALLAEALARVQSATSLTYLLCNPLEFIWRYGFGWRAPEVEDEAIGMPRHVFGTVMHAVLEQSVRELNGQLDRANGGAAHYDRAIQAAMAQVEARLAIEGRLPPRLIWHAQRTQIQQAVQAILCETFASLPGQTSWVELDFGCPPAAAGHAAPYSPTQLVRLADTGMCLRGRIDRLDLDGFGEYGRIIDYKTGALPLRAPKICDALSIQGALYAYAMRQLMPQLESLEVCFVYTRNAALGTGAAVELSDLVERQQATLQAVALAQAAVSSGNVLPGFVLSADAAIAAPGNFATAYISRKTAAISAALPELSELWLVK